MKAPALPKATKAVLRAINGSKAPELKEGSKLKQIDVEERIKKDVDGYFFHKNMMDLAGARIAEYVATIQDNEAYTEGYHNSYAIKGYERRADVVFSDRWTIKNESEAGIILGKYADDVLQKGTTLKIKEEVNQLPTKIKELKELLGDRFGEFFEEKEETKVLKGFNKLIYKLFDKANLWRVRTVLRQAKPQIREGK